VKLDIAAKHVRHRWTGSAHRALADAQACRSVWLFLENQLKPLSEPPAKAPQNKRTIVSVSNTKGKPNLPGSNLVRISQQASSAAAEKASKQATPAVRKWKFVESVLERGLCRIPLKSLRVVDGTVEGFEVKDLKSPDVVWIGRLEIDADFHEIYRHVRQFSGRNS
jgi:hypothetical protein